MTDVCPNCGSVSIASNPKDLRRTAAAAAMASSNPVLSVLGAVGAAVNAVSPAFTCQACGHGFENLDHPSTGGPSMGGKDINPIYIAFKAMLLKHKTRSRPDFPESFPEAFAFSDPKWVDPYPNAHVHGWACRSEANKGTLLAAHGWFSNSFEDRIVRLAKHAHQKGWNVVCPDLRMHGRSHNACPSFGLAESWDISSVIDWLFSQGYPAPFVVAGFSLGSLAASNLAARDPRVSAGFFMAPPAWPMDAVGVTVKVLAPSAKLIDWWYGFPIMGAGDLRRLGPVAHKPHIVYAMGEKDMYGIEKTRSVFRSRCWGGGDEITASRSEKRKLDWKADTNLFIQCIDAGHQDFEWDQFPIVVNAFDELLARSIKHEKTNRKSAAKLPSSSTKVRIRSLGSPSRVIDVSHFGYKDGTKIHLWEQHKMENQKFVIVPIGKGVFKIECPAAEKCIDVADSRGVNGSVVHLWKYVDGGNQKWRFFADDQEGLLIQCAHSGRFLDADADGLKRNGCKIQCWDYHGGLNQRWIIEPCEPATQSNAVVKTVKPAKKQTAKKKTTKKSAK